MWNRAWLNKILAPLGLLIFGLIKPVISQAKDPIDLSVNQYRLDGKIYAVVVIDVDPLRPVPKVFKDRQEWIKYIHLAQERYNQAKQVLMATQTLVKENFLERHRTTEFANTTAFEFPDAEGTQEILLEAGIVRPKTKVEDVLSRRSVTVSVCEGTDWLHRSDATVKLVETDFARLYKDFKKYLPEGLFQKLTTERKVEGFEFENLSVKRRLNYNFFPFMMNLVFDSGAIQERCAIKPETKVYLQTSSQASSQLYDALGFNDFFWNNATKLQFMHAGGLELVERARKFFDVSALEDYWRLPWIDKRTTVTAASQEYAVGHYIREGTLMIREYLSKAPFKPGPNTAIRIESSCIKNFEAQSDAQNP